MSCSHALPTESLLQHFAKFGEVTKVDVMRDRTTGAPRGFGFITFRDEAVADLVCKERHTIDGRQIDAKRSVPPGTTAAKPKSRKIFVGGLAPETTNDLFWEYFNQFGTVVDAQIMQDHNSGRSRGFGFVTFEDDSSVERVFQAGSMQTLAGKTVEIKTATPRGSGPVQGGGRGGGRGGGGGSSGGRGKQYDSHSGGRGSFSPGAYDAQQQQRMVGGYGMMAGEYMPMGYSMGVYGMGYGTPYGAYNGMMMQQMGYGYGQGYGGASYGYGMGFSPQQAGFEIGSPQGASAAAAAAAADAQAVAAGMAGSRYHPYAR